jgi:hypothetical protein
MHPSHLLPLLGIGNLPFLKPPVTRRCMCGCLVTDIARQAFSVGSATYPLEILETRPPVGFDVNRLPSIAAPC